LPRGMPVCKPLIRDITVGEQMLLVLEQDDSIIHWDKQRLIELTRAQGRRDTLRYEHHRARSELLLAVPDAIAWCWARGGQWKQRIQPVIFAVTAQIAPPPPRAPPDGCSRPTDPVENLGFGFRRKASTWD
jgi:hypothetical protein